MYILLVYIIMLIKLLLEVPRAAFATPLATFKDDYDKPSTPTTSYTNHHISGGRVAPHATQAIGLGESRVRAGPKRS